MGIRKGLKYSRELCKPFVKVPGDEFLCYNWPPGGSGKTENPRPSSGALPTLSTRDLIAFGQRPEGRESQVPKCLAASETNPNKEEEVKHNRGLCALTEAYHTEGGYRDFTPDRACRGDSSAMCSGGRPIRGIPLPLSFFTRIESPGGFLCSVVRES